MDSATKTILERCDPVKVGYGTMIYENVIMTRKERIVIGDHCRIDDFVKLEGGKGLKIGKHVHIASFAHLNIGGGELILGDFTAVASGAKIITGGNRLEGKSMSAVAPLDDQLLEYGRVTVCPYACVLTNAVVLPGCVLGIGSRLAAGAVLTKSMLAYEIWAGVPAKKIGEVKR